jgi:hypothetical protein
VCARERARSKPLITDDSFFYKHAPPSLSLPKTKTKGGDSAPIVVKASAASGGGGSGLSAGLLLPLLLILAAIVFQLYLKK